MTSGRRRRSDSELACGITKAEAGHLLHRQFLVPVTPRRKPSKSPASYEHSVRQRLESTTPTLLRNLQFESSVLICTIDELEANDAFQAATRDERVHSVAEWTVVEFGDDTSAEYAP